MLVLLTFLIEILPEQTIVSSFILENILGKDSEDFDFYLCYEEEKVRSQFACLIKSILSDKERFPDLG